MDFLICYEHIVREVENYTLLKHELKKRGYSCKIMRFDDIDYCLHTGKDKAKVVVTPWLRTNANVHRYLPLAQKPYKLVNLQWEQVYCNFHVEQGMTSTFDEALKAYHACWGENARNRLIESGASIENLPIVGAIQMDYGFPLFKDYFLPREEIARQFGLNEQKKWNLLISSFAYANYGDDSIRTMEKNLDMCMDELVDLYKRSQVKTLDWVEQLLPNFEGEFIYRPHPSENVDQRLSRMTKEYPNFHVISNLSVKQWAKVCDKVNLWISTSNAELLSMNINYAIVRPIEVPYDFEVESMRNETYITDLEAFIRYNTSYTDEDPVSVATRLKNLTPFYSFDPEYPAYKRTADFLEQVLKSEKGQTYHFPLKVHLKETFRDIKRYIISVLTRKCYLSDSLKPVQYLPLKPIIKKNMELRIQKYKEKEAVENAMLDYLRKQEAK